MRQGKRFELEVDDGADAAGRRPPAAEALLANPVIEDFTVRVEAEASPGAGVDRSLRPARLGTPAVRDGEPVRGVIQRS